MFYFDLRRGENMDNSLNTEFLYEKIDLLAKEVLGLDFLELTEKEELNMQVKLLNKIYYGESQS